MQIITGIIIYLIIGSILTAGYYSYIGEVAEDDPIAAVVLLWPVILLIAISIVIEELLHKIFNVIICKEDEDADIEESTSSMK